MKRKINKPILLSALALTQGSGAVMLVQNSIVQAYAEQKNKEVIYQHISVINDLTEKQIKRNKLEKIVPLMLEFREIDKKSRIV